MDWVAFNERALKRMQQEDFAGYDPFDALNSRLLRATPFIRSRFVRLATLQLVKRSPINLRSILCVPPDRNSKGVALVVLGLLYDFRRSGVASLLDLAVDLGNWLITQSCDEAVWSGKCWGYNFDWQARAFFVPKGKPNIISTVYVSKALFALGVETGDERFTDAAVSASRFITKHLLIERSSGSFFSYIPGERLLVHNASLWGAACCAHAFRVLGDMQLSTIVSAVVDTSLNAQRTDGAWVYGEAPFHQFVDGFHTGYNLEALDEVGGILQSSAIQRAVRLGAAYYYDHFFEGDGKVKYYDTEAFPVDMHSVAQALILMSHPSEVFHATIDRKVLIGRVLHWVEFNMCNDDLDGFYYQRTRYYTNKTRYIRWTQAWMYYALARLNFYGW